MTAQSHAPRMVSDKHFSGTLCGARGDITVNRPTCSDCQRQLEEKAPTSGGLAGAGGDHNDANGG